MKYSTLAENYSALVFAYNMSVLDENAERAKYYKTFIDKIDCIINSVFDEKHKTILNDLIHGVKVADIAEKFCVSDAAIRKRIDHHLRPSINRIISVIDDSLK